ncbi:PucR family transcriptional regulator [Lentzea atacamensis]|uniref:PucR family transcriptional regulator n=1 Tax=Lentzea atacamensis TaxID=531938 RepID=UPI001B88044E
MVVLVGGVPVTVVHVVGVVAVRYRDMAAPVTVGVIVREGLLVCVVPHDLGGAPEEFARQVGEVVGRNTVWRVGLSQPQSGPGGAVRSFEQARNALDMAERPNLDERLVKAADLLVYQVLLRDSAALGELVTAVLEPLRGARGGAQRLVDTLASYFASGRVTTTTAQALGIGVRTVTYRLDRVRELTGYRADDPAQAFTLQVAVLGARLLGWPRAGPWA